jgi:cystathionine beta-lyase
MTAIIATLLSVLSAGDHVLVTDDVRRPSRHFCHNLKG